MRLFRVIGYVAVAGALSWAAFATAQENGADNETELDGRDAPAAADADVPTEIPEELLESRYIDEIKVIVCCKFDKFLVFVAQSRQFYMHGRDVYRFTLPDDPIVFDSRLGPKAGPSSIGREG